MKRFEEPKIIFIDPKLIKFNPKNHRIHRGPSFARLKENIENVGLVQLPTVRIVGHNLYECLDGEGRIRSEIENGKERIYVVSFGEIDDNQAIKMLEAANIARDYNILAICKGLASLKDQGLNTRDILKQYTTTNRERLNEMISIGSLPTEMLEKIDQDILNGKENIWTFRLLRALLPLRVEIGRHEESRGKGGSSRKMFYDFGEVEKAVELVILGQISNSVKMERYVAERKIALFQTRFDEIVKKRLKNEVDSAKRELEAGRNNVFAEKEKEYQQSLALLSEKYASLNAKYSNLLNNVTARPEIIERQEAELRQQIEDTRKAKEEVIKTREKIENETKQIVDRLLETQRAQLNESFEKERFRKENEHKKQLEDIERDLQNQIESFRRKSEKKQIEAENSIRQTMLHASGNIIQTQKSLALLFSQNYKIGLTWLTVPELSMLYNQLDALNLLIEDAKINLRNVVEQENVAIQSGESAHV